MIRSHPALISEHLDPPKGIQFWVHFWIHSWDHSWTQASISLRKSLMESLYVQVTFFASKQCSVKVLFR